VLDSLISAYWTFGGALEEGISVTDSRVRGELEAAKGRPFRSEQAFRAFLAETGENIPDLLFNLKEQVLSGALRGKIEAQVGDIGPARVARYYVLSAAVFGHGRGCSCC
jgi:hypothetical protein